MKQGFVRDRRHGVGPFVTWTSEPRPDGRLLLRTSRRQRKGQPALLRPASAVHPRQALADIRHDWTKLWAPRRIGWWIALAFMIGSALFALGSAGSLPLPLGAVPAFGAESAAWIFFAGSLFFTTAGYLQYFEAINNDLLDVGREHRALRFLALSPRNLGFVATAVQLVGTLLFNANTGDSLIRGLDGSQEQLLIWVPDLFGSICFLVASQAALMEVSHSYWSWRPRDLVWWIAAVNMLGSTFFMISALAAFITPAGRTLLPYAANLGTLAGALCFLLGAYLLIPELFEVPEDGGSTG